MSNNENLTTTGCVPVFKRVTRGPDSVQNTDFADPIGGVQDHPGGAAGPSDLGDRDGGELLGPQQDEGSLRSGRPGAGDGGPGHGFGLCMDGYTAPVTRSPYDPWHSEEYLVSCLVKTHGWTWLEARVLRGPWRKPAKVHSFMAPEGE